MAEHLCFIHWATKCRHDIKYIKNYWYPECDTWIDDLITDLEQSDDTADQLYLQNAQELRDLCR